VYPPPHNLSSDNFADLLRVIPDARQLLGVSDRTLRRWLASGQVPRIAVLLLWYAGPAGREDAARDLANELQLITLERDALRRELQAMSLRSDPGRFNDRLAANDGFVPEHHPSTP